jgi:hypothetical protein
MCRHLTLRSRELIEVLSRHLVGVTEENDKKYVRIDDAFSRFERTSLVH